MKRSLAHRKFTLRLVDQKVVLQGMNDTPEVWKTKVKSGYATFDGTKMDLKDLEVQVDAGSRSYLYQMELPAKITKRYCHALCRRRRFCMASDG